MVYIPGATALSYDGRRCFLEPRTLQFFLCSRSGEKAPRAKFPLLESLAVPAVSVPDFLHGGHLVSCLG